MADKVITQGGITSIYYFGTVWGCLLSGWISDTFGRVTALQTGSLWCMLGIALEASAQSQPWIICARLIAGVGVGHMNAIAPTWVSEVSEAAHRGKLFALVYLSNYVGIALAYWLGFGLSYIDGGQSGIRWRLPFAINAVPPFILFCLLPFVPESPRYLLSVDKSAEALEVLAHVRAEGDQNNEAVQAEYQEIHASVEYAKANSASNGYLPMLLGLHGGNQHFAHRTQLALLLPLFTQVGTGIAATTIYAPALIQQAGWGEEKAEWLSALNNTVGILGTVISMLTIDPVGRRLTLLWGSLAQSACMWIIGAMSVLTASRPDQASQYGSASVAFIFVFTLIYSSTYLIINFNYPGKSCDDLTKSKHPLTIEYSRDLPYRSTLPRHGIWHHRLGCWPRCRDAVQSCDVQQYRGIWLLCVRRIELGVVSSGTLVSTGDKRPQFGGD